jgi:PRTRC genetic system protein B
MLVSSLNNEELKPFINMVFYQSSNHFYGEFAKINGKGKINKYEPISLVGLESFIAKIKNSDNQQERLKFTGIIPSNVLNYDSGTLSPDITWYSKSRVAELNILKKKGLFPYPTLVFKLRNKKLHIYAAPTNNISSNTKLYNAPFPNIYGDGALCFGTMDINKFMRGSDYNDIMKSMENAFYNSKFTSDLMGGQPTKSPVLPLIEKLLNSGLKFPKKELVKTNKTVRNVLRK